MSTHTTEPAADQQPHSHRLRSGWGVREAITQRPVPSNQAACVVLAQLLLESLTVEIALPPEGVVLIDALVDLLVPAEVGERC